LSMARGLQDVNAEAEEQDAQPSIALYRVHRTHGANAPPAEEFIPPTLVSY